MKVKLKHHNKTIPVIYTLVSLFLLVLVNGCGYKTDPVPPQDIVPEAITDMRYQIIDGGVRLLWSYPVKTVQGKDIESISNFDLYRAGVALENDCPNCPIPFGSPHRLPGGTVLDGAKRRTASYDILDVKPGYKYFFKVVSRSGWWASSANSNVVTFVYEIPPAAPTGLQVEPGDNEVRLRWNPVTTLQNGQPLSRPVLYEVARNGKKIADSITSAQYTDSNVQNGVNYSYRVKSKFAGSTAVSGKSSSSAKAAPVDTTPPKPITGVRAVSVHKGVTVFWDSCEEENIKSYRIYRRASTSSQYQMVAEVEPQYTVYTDTAVKGDSRFLYVVTVIDANGNESNYSSAAAPRE